MKRAVRVSLDLISYNPYQVRMELNDQALLALAQSIYANGLLQPPTGRLVREDNTPVSLTTLEGSEKFADTANVSKLLHAGNLRVQIAFGHRRLEAYRLLADGVIDPGRAPNFRLMPVFLTDLDDETMARAAWTENEERQNLTPIEQARAIAKMRDHFGWKRSVLAERLGLTEIGVTRKLSLLELTPEWQDALHRADVGESQALTVLPALRLPEAAQKRAARSDLRIANDLLALAEAGATCEELERRVDIIFAMLTNVFEDHGVIVPPHHDFGGVKGIRQSSCADCPGRVSRGNLIRCADIDCFNVKRALYEDIVLAAAQGQFGLDVAPPETEPRALSTFWRDEGLVASTILRDGCEHQCLRLRAERSPQAWHPEGHPSVALVCLHGSGNRCRCRSVVKANMIQGDGDAPAKAKRDTRQAKREVERDVITPLSQALLEAWAEQTVAGWRAILAGIHGGFEIKARDWDLDRCRKEAAEYLARQWRDWAETDVRQARINAEIHLDNCGLAAPWSSIMHGLATPEPPDGYRVSNTEPILFESPDFWLCPVCYADGVPEQGDIAGLMMSASDELARCHVCGYAFTVSDLPEIGEMVDA